MNLYHCFECGLDVLCDLLPQEMKHCPLCAAPDPHFLNPMTREDYADRVRSQAKEECLEDLAEAFSKLSQASD